MVHDITPQAEELLKTTCMHAYVGFDPTGPSLHIGNLVQIMLMKHLMNYGHKVTALIGGATAMIGDPSGKSEERSMLSSQVVIDNSLRIREQLNNLLDVGPDKESVFIANNYQWISQISLLDFLRDTGKHFSVSNMLAKDSVKNRLSTGISLTEFTYQALQAYDFLLLNQLYDVNLQVGGSDQWGNMISGVDLIRKKGREANAFTCPLVTKADGSKFGKSEQGNVWLDPTMTSPFQFYQFWLNVSDDDAARYLKLFTFLNLEAISQLEESHHLNPSLRIMQEKLAELVTAMIHGAEKLEQAKLCTDILFGDTTQKSIDKLTVKTLDNVFSGVNKFVLSRDLLQANVPFIDLLVSHTEIFPSKNEARKMINGGGVSINKSRINALDIVLNNEMLLKHKYMLIQKGKKHYFVIEFV